MTEIQNPKQLAFDLIWYLEFFYSLVLNDINLNFGISSVGAASSRDFAIMAIEQLLFTAGSPSHEILMLSLRQ